VRELDRYSPSHAFCRRRSQHETTVTVLSQRERSQIKFNPVKDLFLEDCRRCWETVPLVVELTWTVDMLFLYSRWTCDNRQRWHHAVLRSHSRQTWFCSPSHAPPFLYHYQYNNTIHYSYFSTVSLRWRLSWEYVMCPFSSSFLPFLHTSSRSGNF